MANFVLIILDSMGIGELPDALFYNDVGSDTLGHILEKVEKVENVHLPNLEALGLGKIKPLKGINPNVKVRSAFGKLASLSKGKDTTVGHFELMGLILDKPFSTFPKGFPTEFMKALIQKSKYEFLGNMAASGTEIINLLGAEHLSSKKPIIYTSSDSVCQIAAHEDIITIDKLYSLCETARELCDSYSIARVIARPFEGEIGNFKRTSGRKDFSMPPLSKTALDILFENGIETIGIGKIDDIFAGSGLSKKIHSKGNLPCIDSTINEIKKSSDSFIFTNLVDMDMLYGHRRDPLGYYNSIKEFDQKLPEILASLSNDDILVITADHGNDPCFKGTDHTREYVPLLVFSKKIKAEINLETGKTFANVGKTALTFFKIKDNNNTISGISFLNKLF